MVVSITWSESAGGAAMDDPKNWGTIGNGSAASALEIFISHDGTNAITNCGLYVQAYSGTGYTGSAGTAADLSEILAWGDTSTTAQGGDPATGGDDGGFWVRLASTGTAWYVHNSSTGISGTEFGLPTGMNLATADEIASGEEATMAAKIIVPTYEATAGTRFFDHALKYTYTS
jgi:hypothetical protein